MSQTTDTLPTDSSTNTQLQTEDTNGQIKLTFSAEGQTELANEHAKKQIEQINIADGQIKPSANTQLQTEHANGPIKSSDRQTELANGHAEMQIENINIADKQIELVERHAKWQIEHAKKQTEHGAGKLKAVTSTR